MSNFTIRKTKFNGHHNNIAFTCPSLIIKSKHIRNIKLRRRSVFVYVCKVRLYFCTLYAASYIKNNKTIILALQKLHIRNSNVFGLELK